MKLQLKTILSLFLLLTYVSVVTAQWKEYNGTIQAPGGFYTKEQINALVASAISGSGTPNMLDAIFGTGTLLRREWVQVSRNWSAQVLLASKARTCRRNFLHLHIRTRG